MGSKVEMRQILKEVLGVIQEAHDDLKRCREVREGQKSKGRIGEVQWAWGMEGSVQCWLQRPTKWSEVGHNSQSRALRQAFSPAKR